VSSPTSIPSLSWADTAVPSGQSWDGSFRSMASRVNVSLGPGTTRPELLFAEIGSVFAQVEAECTRFDRTSDLMRANAATDEWCRVGSYCYRALEEAAHAHQFTGGLFDPRVLSTLQQLGYVHSLPFAAGRVEVSAPEGRASSQPATHAPWQLVTDPAERSVRIGPIPVDLGGIGKGLAVRWALERAAQHSPSLLIEAGGDCFLRGMSPDGAAWQVGVEDPQGGDKPIAVLALSDLACATSSIRLRQWRVDGATAHHLIDPRTGTPGGTGILAVTVVARDPAEAEVWSKVLFLQGMSGIAATAERLGLAALWAGADGSLAMSSTMHPFVIWTAS